MSSDDPPDAASNPLYGATPPPTTSTQSRNAPHDTSRSTNISDVTVNPLFGSTPATEPKTPAERTEATSAKRVHDLKIDRDTPLSASSTPTLLSPVVPAPAISSPPPVLPPRPSQPLTSSRNPHTNIQTYIKRLTSLLSIILGTSAILTLTWSYFLLPLLHSSFSARKVIVEGQVERITSLVDRLREIRSCGLYTSTSQPVDTIKEADVESEGEGAKDIQEVEENATALPISIPPLFSTLSPSLRDLTSALSSTSTTRTSLLSTLESYTSYLHRQMYLRNNNTSGGFGLSVGLGSLGGHLSKEGGGGGSVVEPLGRGMEEWDAVRKEVRGVKGLLLGRRNFAGVTA